jgi:hypothetical protein
MSDFDDRAKKSFDLAGDVTKQLITLCTGIIGLTVTFAKDILPRDPGHGGPPGWARLVLATCWILYLLSILFGLLTLLALTSEIDDPADGKGPSIWAGKVRATSCIQISLFFLGTLLIITFSLLVLWAPQTKPTGYNEAGWTTKHPS